MWSKLVLIYCLLKCKAYRIPTYDPGMLSAMSSCVSQANTRWNTMIPGLEIITMTNREIGYCPASHVHLFLFGGLLKSAHETLTFRMRYEVISTRITGGWYSASPVTGSTASTNEHGFCDLYLQDFAPESQFFTLTNPSFWDSFVPPADGSMGALNLLINWAGMSQTPIVDHMVDGLPVARVLIITDTVIPTLSDSSVQQEVMTEAMPQTQMQKQLACLRKHHNCLISPHEPKFTFHMDDGCTVTRPLNDTVRALEERLAAEICPSKKSAILHNENLMSSLNRAGYRYRIITDEDDEPQCPFPEPPTKAQFQEAVNFIRPHYMIITTETTTNYTDAELARIDELAQLSGVPEDHIIISDIDTGLYTITDDLPVKPCVMFDNIPTIAPTDGECDYCEEQYYNRVYMSILAGATAGTILGATGFQFLSSQLSDDNTADVDEIEPAARPQQHDTDHILFAN